MCRMLEANWETEVMNNGRSLRHNGNEQETVYANPPLFQPPPFTSSILPSFKYLCHFLSLSLSLSVPPSHIFLTG